jgi:hypothetical protein
MNAIQWFRVEARVEGTKEPFVDWYNAESEAEALDAWLEDCHRYGLPLAKTTATIRVATDKEAEACAS